MTIYLHQILKTVVKFKSMAYNLFNLHICTVYFTETFEFTTANTHKMKVAYIETFNLDLEKKNPLGRKVILAI